MCLFEPQASSHIDPKFRVPHMLTAKRAGARLGYPTPLQQRAVLEKKLLKQLNRLLTIQLHHPVDKHPQPRAEVAATGVHHVQRQLASV
jgi:hypothetical protein